MNSAVKASLVVALLLAVFYREQLKHLIEGQGGTGDPQVLPPNPPAAPATNTRARLLAAAQREPAYQANQTLSPYQWNFLFHAVRGIEPPPPSAMQFGDAPLTIDEFWTGATAAGLSGARTGRRAARAWGI